MSKIEKLTPEQEAYLPAFRQEYLDAAFGGHRADRDLLEDAIADAYATIDRPAPTTVFILQSPLQAMVAMSPWLRIGGLECGPLQGRLRKKISYRLPIEYQLQSQLGDDLRDYLWRELLVEIGGQVRTGIDGQVRSDLETPDAKGRPKDIAFNPYSLPGSQDFNWIALGKFAEHIGVRFIGAGFKCETSRHIEIMRRIGFECEFWWPYEEYCFVSEKPVKTSWDEQGRLHCADGPAVLYEDGYALYALNGKLTMPGR